MLICVDWCRARVDSCWLVLDSCWFVSNSCWLLLIRVYSCWLVLILVYYNRLDPFQIMIEWIFSTLMTSDCETSMKMYWKSSEKFRKYKEKFKFSCSLWVTKMDNNLESTSVHSSLDLGNKIWIGKPFIDSFSHNFTLQKPPSRFFFLVTRQLWSYLKQVFLVGCSSFLLSNYTVLGLKSDWLG